MREMTVDSVRINPRNYQRVLILKEKDGDLYVPIWIGLAEADVIAVKIQDASVPRPLTHDLIGNIVVALGGSVQHILIREVRDDFFHADIVIQRKNLDIEDIDSRASDAVALAIRVQAPIYINEEVLEKTGIRLDQETGKFVTGGGEDTSEHDSASNPLSAEELKSMSAFTALVNDMEALDDLGKENKDDPSSPS